MSGDTLKRVPAVGIFTGARRGTIQDEQGEKKYEPRRPSPQIE